MKIAGTYRVISLVLAVMLFVSSTGFSIDLHYCKDDLKSFSFMGEAKSCHAKMSQCPRHSAVDDSADKSDCCSNKNVQVDELDSDYNTSPSVELTDKEVQFAASFVLSYVVSLPTVPAEINDYKKEVPIVSRDIYVLLERFLL